jgi:FAD binding domain
MTITARFPATTVGRWHFDGQVLTPGTRGYDSARSVWNGTIDHRPELIVQCASVADVVTAVRIARERDLEIGVRCGGHNIAGLAVPHGGLMIDLTTMGRVTVDRSRGALGSRAARCSARWTGPRSTSALPRPPAMFRILASAG